MQRYFAYGSNLSTQQMQARCPSAQVLSPCILEGWRLSFIQPHQGWGGGVAGIVRDAASIVHGVVYELSDSDLLALDSYEPVDEGDYRRTGAHARLPNGELLDCWIYVGDVYPGAPFAPSARYLQTVLGGAREHGLPVEYISWLEVEFAPWDA